MVPRVPRPALVALLAIAVTPAAAVLARGSCPPLLAGLMPKNAVHVSGQYTSQGIIGLGSAAADLPFDNVCTRQVTPTPGKLTFDIKHYADEGAEMFQMQIGAVESQMLEDRRRDFEKRHRPLAAPGAKVDSVSPIRTEQVPGGTMLYFDYWTDCSEGTKRSKPTVYLFAVAHTASSAITVEVDGFISAAAASAAAREVIAAFMKADFSAQK